MTLHVPVPSESIAAWQDELIRAERLHRSAKLELKDSAATHLKQTILSGYCLGALSEDSSDEMIRAFELAGA